MICKKHIYTGKKNINVCDIETKVSGYIINKSNFCVFYIENIVPANGFVSLVHISNFNSEGEDWPWY